MAAIANFHQQESLNCRNLFPHNSGDQRSKINVLNVFCLLGSLSFVFTGPLNWSVLMDPILSSAGTFLPASSTSFTDNNHIESLSNHIGFILAHFNLIDYLRCYWQISSYGLRPTYLTPLDVNTSKELFYTI